MPWRDFPSQPLVGDLLNRALRHGRVHHSYLMIGGDSETEPVAMGFAQALNCEKNDGDFCGRCESCRDIAVGKHPDVYRIRPESKSRRILITQVRELERAVYLKASRARRKVAVIHSADRMNEEAQNAFLKTLEEPPLQTVLLLLTEEPQVLRETIISRCLRMLFRQGLKKEKTDNEKQVETWLSEFVSASSPVPGVFRAYSLTGRMLGLLKQMRDKNLEGYMDKLDDPSIDNMEASQRKRLEEQITAQAEAEYRQERTRLLKTILHWYRNSSRPASSGSAAIDPKIVNVLENLSRRLNQNINESLALEIAFLQLSEG